MLDFVDSRRFVSEFRGDERFDDRLKVNWVVGRAVGVTTSPATPRDLAALQLGLARNRVSLPPLTTELPVLFGPIAGPVPIAFLAGRGSEIRHSVLCQVVGFLATSRGPGDPMRCARL